MLSKKLCKKTIYHILVIKVNAIDTKISDTRAFVTETQYDSDNHGLKKQIADADKKIPNICGLVKKTDYNTKVTQIGNKIPSVAGLMTTAARNTKPTEIEYKIPDITNQVTKAALNIKA